MVGFKFAVSIIAQKGGHFGRLKLDNSIISALAAESYYLLVSLLFMQIEVVLLGE
jgi:hypothetical protein